MPTLEVTKETATFIVFSFRAADVKLIITEEEFTPVMLSHLKACTFHFQKELSVTLTAGLSTTLLNHLE